MRIKFYGFIDFVPGRLSAFTIVISPRSLNPRLRYSLT